MAETSTPIKEGHLPFSIPIPIPNVSLPTPCNTFYKIVGDLSTSSSPAPLVILHGGPSAGHEYLLAFASLWDLYQIPVIFYDQIGCASSTHAPDDDTTAGNESLWTEDLFLAELDNLLDGLRLRPLGFSLLGHSWGGRLAAAFAARRPWGLRKLVLASAIASTETVNRGNELNRRGLGEEVWRALEEQEDAQGNRGRSERFKQAEKVYMRTYFWRGQDEIPPEGLLQAAANVARDKVVRPTIYGSSPLRCTGSFRTWTVVPRLSLVEVPTLVYNGEFDSSHDVTTAPFFEHIPRVKWITFAGAGHMAHLEGKELRERIIRTVGRFLTEEEGAGDPGEATMG